MGLFGFNPDCDFATISIINNVIRCEGLTRPLLRNDESYGATVRNNRLQNVSDADRYENRMNQATVGLENPLAFQCGVRGETTVDGWHASPSPSRESCQWEGRRFAGEGPPLAKARPSREAREGEDW